MPSTTTFALFPQAAVAPTVVPEPDAVVPALALAAATAHRPA